MCTVQHSSKQVPVPCTSAIVWNEISMNLLVEYNLSVPLTETHTSGIISHFLFVKPISLYHSKHRRHTISLKECSTQLPEELYFYFQGHVFIVTVSML